MFCLNKSFERFNDEFPTIIQTYRFGGCIDSPAIAVTVSDSSRSPEPLSGPLTACIAEKPTVWASRLTQGQCVIWMAIVFWSVSIAD